MHGERAVVLAARVVREIVVLRRVRHRPATGCLEGGRGRSACPHTPSRQPSRTIRVGPPPRSRVLACTALPPVHEPRPNQIRREPVKRVHALLQEVRELGDELEEVAQHEEAAVERPGRANERLRRVDVHVDVVLAPAQDGALAHGLLAGVGLGVEFLDRGLGDPVEEAEAGDSAGLSWQVSKLIRGGSASLLLVTLLVAWADDTFQGKDLLKRNAATDVEEA